MTPNEALETLRRLAELRAKSTPGIWRVGLIGISRARPIARCCNQDVLSDYDGNCGEDGEDFSDAPFIAAARNTDFPALAEAVEGTQPSEVTDADVGSVIEAAFSDGSFRLRSRTGAVRRVEFFRSAKEAELAEIVSRMERERDEARQGLGEGHTRPHETPENCPTYYDGCNCTVEVLTYNIDRAQKAETSLAAANAEIARLKEIEQQYNEILTWCREHHNGYSDPDGATPVTPLQAIAELWEETVRSDDTWSQMYVEMQEAKDAEIARLRERVAELEGVARNCLDIASNTQSPAGGARLAIQNCLAAVTETIDRMTAQKIYDVLIVCCGAPQHLHDDCVQWMIDGAPAREFRFQGSLGFGGKLYITRQRWRVSCYSEDETPERLAAIERANKRLAELRSELTGGGDGE